MVDRPMQEVDVRIMLYPSPSNPWHVNITPQGGSNSLSRQSVILDATTRPGGSSVGTVIIKQSGRDMGFDIMARARSADKIA